MIYGDFDLLQKNTSVPVDRYSHVSAIWCLHIGLLRDPNFSATAPMCRPNIAEDKAEIAAMDKTLVE